MRCLLTLVFVCLCSLGFAQTDSTYILQDSVIIPTKSGIDLSAIVVRKKGTTGPLPAILFYTTYHQGLGDAAFGKMSADRGYVGIVVYASGIKTDISKYKPYENEAADVYDSIDWISKQWWCDGSVAMFGGSYTGFSQWAAAKRVHPTL
jgi:putative CocE/NonD family hydrolase